MLSENFACFLREDWTTLVVIRLYLTTQRPKGAGGTTLSSLAQPTVFYCSLSIVSLRFLPCTI